jgi:hypothetical protein
MNNIKIQLEIKPPSAPTWNSFLPPPAPGGTAPVVMSPVANRAPRALSARKLNSYQPPVSADLGTDVNVGPFDRSGRLY